MGRLRSATVPPGIDPAKLPAGVYWQPTGRGRWYALERDPATGRAHRRRLAGPDARLSDLHALVETRTEKGTVAAVLDAFHASAQFRKLEPRTRKDYGHYAAAIKKYPARVGGTFGALHVDRLSPPVIRRWIDAIAADTPSKAAHWLRYIKRTFQWGMQYGECRTNPAREVRGVKEDADPHMPELVTFRAVQAFARERGAMTARRRGSVAPYLWAAMEIAYACRLRGVEVLKLTDASVTDDDMLAERRKGSRATRVAWSPALREAVTFLQGRRDAIWASRKMPVPFAAKHRPLFVSERGDALTRSGFDTTWQRMMRLAVKGEKITAAQRFGLHGLKHRGVTDTAGTLADKKQASGHRTDAMVDRYDHEIPIVQPPTRVGKTPARNT